MWHCFLVNIPLPFLPPHPTLKQTMVSLYSCVGLLTVAKKKSLYFLSCDQTFFLNFIFFNGSEKEHGTGRQWRNQPGMGWDGMMSAAMQSHRQTRRGGGAFFALFGQPLKPFFQKTKVILAVVKVAPAVLHCLWFPCSAVLRTCRTSHSGLWRVTEADADKDTLRMHGGGKRQE